MGKGLSVKALQTTFQIIDLLSEKDMMTFSEIAEQLDQPNSTVYDHLQSLRKLFYITKDGDQYQLSYEFLLIGDRQRNSNELFVQARSVVDEIAEITGEHASLFIEEEGRGRTIYTKQGENDVDFNIYDGEQSHLPFTAPGKAILSILQRSRVEELLDKQRLLQDPTTDSITRSELHDELELTSERGFSLDKQISFKGVRGIAVPILDKNNQVQGAISIYGPAHRVGRNQIQDQLVRVLKDKKNMIEVYLHHANRP